VQALVPVCALNVLRRGKTGEKEEQLTQLGKASKGETVEELGSPAHLKAIMRFFILSPPNTRNRASSKDRKNLDTCGWRNERKALNFSLHGDAHGNAHEYC